MLEQMDRRFNPEALEATRDFDPIDEPLCSSLRPSQFIPSHLIPIPFLRQSMAQVRSVIRQAVALLRPGGTIVRESVSRPSGVLTHASLADPNPNPSYMYTQTVHFRDLTYHLQGVDRFLPCRNDENNIFTCACVSPVSRPRPPQTSRASLYVSTSTHTYILTTGVLEYEEPKPGSEVRIPIDRPPDQSAAVWVRRLLFSTGSFTRHNTTPTGPLRAHQRPLLFPGGARQSMAFQEVAVPQARGPAAGTTDRTDES